LPLLLGEVHGKTVRLIRWLLATAAVWCGFSVFWGINAIENHDRIARAPANYFVIGVAPGLLAVGWGLGRHRRRTAQT
jgi:hypothetical protein